MNAIVLASRGRVLWNGNEMLPPLQSQEHLGEQVNLSSFDLLRLMNAGLGENGPRVNSLVDDVDSRPQRISGQSTPDAGIHAAVLRKEPSVRVEYHQAGGREQSGSNDRRIDQESKAGLEPNEQIDTLPTVQRRDIPYRRIRKAPVLADLLTVRPAYTTKPIPRRHRTSRTRQQPGDFLAEDADSALALADHGINHDAAAGQAGQPLAGDRSRG